MVDIAKDKLIKELGQEQAILSLAKESYQRYIKFTPSILKFKVLNAQKRVIANSENSIVLMKRRLALL